MSQEIFEIVKQMNLDNLEVQIALQCAPLISGLRFSNLFNVNNEQADYLISLMNEMHISWKILFRGKEKLTMLLYKKDILEKLTNINQEYHHLLKQYDESPLITIHQDNYKEYQEYIFSIIHKTLMNLSPDDTYRKRDLLKSIERKHQL